MRSRILKTSRARMVALAASAGAAGLLATASAASAAVIDHHPAVGSNCQLDGKISGGGSTFQTNAMLNAVIYGYQQDVCGPIGAATNLNSTFTSDPSEYTATLNQGASTQKTAAVGGMVAYNYSNPNGAAKNGSGAGLQRISCRTEAFGGTDLPYSTAQLTSIDGVPGAESSNCSSNLNLTGATAVPPPFGPPTTTYPNTSDSTTNAMNFPLAGGAVAIAVNLNGSCTTTPAAGTTINLTSDEFDKIMQGTINKWSDTELDTTNPILSTDGCTGNITRVVRHDSSGTTSITLNYLGAGNGGTAGIDTGATCDGTNWLNFFTINGGSTGGGAGDWPENCTGDGQTAPSAVDSGSNGSQTLITKLEGTNGGVGYAELGLWATLPAGDFFANLESQAATAANGLSDATPPAGSFIAPGSAGASSNCNPGANGLPGSGTPAESVGLGGTNDNWANDATPNKENITYSGAGYPVCGLTFDLVYTNMHTETGEVAGASGTPGCTGSTVITGACQTVQGPEIGTTNDQLRTLFSFWTYVFSPLGQSYLDQATYDELPATWLSKLQSGFQGNF